MPNKEIDLLHLFLSYFRERTGVDVVDVWREEPVEGESRPYVDALILVRAPAGDDLKLAVEVMRVAYPRDVRMAIDRLLAFSRTPRDATPLKAMVIAQVLSPGARKALREAGVFFYDTSGTLFIDHGPWVVDVERPPKRETRKPAALFTGAREQVVHALLEHWRGHDKKECLSGVELAELAHTSPFTVSQTMQELEREDLVESTGNGPRQRRRLCNPEGLLDAWARSRQLRRDLTYRYYTFSPNRGGLSDVLVEKLAGRIEWALTGAAAANAAVPYLTNLDRVEVIVPPGRAEQWADELGLKRVEKGSNVVFIEREGASLMFRASHPMREDAFFASPFIQYLDLLNGYGRNKELAQEFRRHALHMEPSI